jgi:hypothetical protein
LGFHPSPVISAKFLGRDMVDLAQELEALEKPWGLFRFGSLILL